MTTDVLFEEVCWIAKNYGMVVDGPDKPKNKSVNAVIRKNYGKGKEKDEDGENKEQSGSDYFGFIREHNEPRGKYEDLSLVFFPQSRGEELCYCIVALGVGTLGLPNDLAIASLPGTRRLFNRLGGTQNENTDPNRFFIKNDFTDIVTDVVTDIINSFNKKLGESQMQVNKIADKYKNYELAGYILTKEDFDTGKYQSIIEKWVAAYAKFRGWPKQDILQKIDNEVLPAAKSQSIEILISECKSESVEQILYRDRFIVLQGAPGTGKTYTALKIWDNCFGDENRFFEQFHAETTYSDFVYGIRPKLNENEIGYKPHKGTLLQAIEKAKELEAKFKISRDSNEDVKPYRVLLVIDEINRANLSNVLGPVFFLFEKNRKQSNVKIEFDGENVIDHLPENLFVIATMNTADRSLAVVDFALRRRFTWLSIKPHKLDKKALKSIGQVFMEDDFKSINEIFEQYASDEELNLQPGQSYFIVNKSNDPEEQKAEMDCRLKYELMPLIKEYLNEGYLSNAKNVFYNYFFKRIGELIYE